MADPLVPGNIDLFRRPKVLNPDGSVSTVRSMSFEDDNRREVLVPTVSADGRILSGDDAIGEYERTGNHLGMFATPDDATDYAIRLHDDYAAGKYERPGKPALLSVNGAPIEMAVSHRDRNALVRKALQQMMRSKR